MYTKPLSKVLRTTDRHIKKLEGLGVKNIQDFLTFFPRTYNDTTEYRKIVDIRTDEVNTIKGRITSLFNIKSKNGKKMTRGIFSDETGTIEVIWFNQPHLTKLLPRDTIITLSGKAKFSFGKISLTGPTFEILKKNTESIHSGRIVPVYHETEGISSKWFREKLAPVINDWIKNIEEYMPQEIIDEHKFIGYKDAIKNIHFPENDTMLNQAVKRLSFDELFLLQLGAIQKKWHWQTLKKDENVKLQIQTESIMKIMNSLSFTLTDAQKRVLKEILADLNKTIPMCRLVQGDVGSGKTIVAAIAAINTVKNHKQVAIMAPTEILAKQHYQTFIKVLGQEGLNIQFIAGSTTKKEKENIIRQMKTGTVDIMIGTHALIQDKIGFKSLGLAIIDEQHRFGVKQRDVLKSFGSPHLLTMTATPIPRTLAITIYGDQDLSIIDEMPKGRQEIVTKVVAENNRKTANLWIEDQINKGRQAFIICPLIDESDTIEVKSVMQEYINLKENVFPNLNIAFLHGKLKQSEKDEIMEEFKDNKTQILVSTSVIEVGIDVPNASIMLIEGAERFGLSQLHQFRGRVGRGEHQSYCFLFTTGGLSEDGGKRLKAMENHSSGFKLSEIDLELRGPGEIYGVKQSGIPDLKMANLMDSLTIDQARTSAQKIIEKDPLLKNYPKLAEKLAETISEPT